MLTSPLRPTESCYSSHSLLSRLLCVGCSPCPHRRAHCLPGWPPCPHGRYRELLQPTWAASADRPCFADAADAWSCEDCVCLVLAGLVPVRASSDATHRPRPDRGHVQMWWRPGLWGRHFSRLRGGSCDVWGQRLGDTDFLGVHQTELAMQGRHQPWLSRAARPLSQGTVVLSGSRWGPGAYPLSMSASRQCPCLCPVSREEPLLVHRDSEAQKPGQLCAGQGWCLRCVGQQLPFLAWLGLAGRAGPPCKAVPLPDAHDKQPHVLWQEGAQS